MGPSFHPPHLQYYVGTIQAHDAMLSNHVAELHRPAAARSSTASTRPAPLPLAKEWTGTRLTAGERCMAARSVLHAVGCLLHVVRWASCVVCGAPPVVPVACCLLHVVCCMLYVVCCMLYAACCMLSVACCMLYAAEMFSSLTDGDSLTARMPLNQRLSAQKQHGLVPAELLRKSAALRVARRRLHVALHVACRRLHVACRRLHVALHVACCALCVGFG